VTFAGVDAEFTGDTFLGSGALSYSWYNNVVVAEHHCPDLIDWTLTFTDDEGIKYKVGHTQLLDVVRKVAIGELAMPDDCTRNCLYMFAGADALELVDFDAVTADCILQQCAFDDVVYG
jgi:hypothetical protein